MTYCLVGETTREPLSYQGRVIVHDNKNELEYLFPYSRVEKLPSYYGNDLTIQLKDHPDMQAVKFPIAQHMDQFRK